MKGLSAPDFVGLDGGVIAPKCVGPLRFHTFHDFTRPRYLFLEGGDARLLGFVGKIGGNPTEGTGVRHDRPPCWKCCSRRVTSTECKNTSTEARPSKR